MTEIKTLPRQPSKRRYRSTAVGLPWLAVGAAVLMTIAYVNRDRYLASSPPSYSRTFEICGSSERINCVVDGDTFWLDGAKIRISDIDTPEIHPPRCADEERLGLAAQSRLQALLNAGPFELTSSARDVDQYGRKLRIIMRKGRSIGGMLVSEHLARIWIGHREPWCGL